MEFSYVNGNPLSIVASSAPQSLYKQLFYIPTKFSTPCSIFATSKGVQISSLSLQKAVDFDSIARWSNFNAEKNPPSS